MQTVRGVNFYEHSLRLNPLLKLFMNTCQANSIQMGIISNGYGPLQRSRIQANNLNSFFDNELIFISSEVGIVKPDEKIFILAEKKVKAHPINLVYFGNDFKKDIEPTRKRGWTALQIGF